MPRQPAAGLAARPADHAGFGGGRAVRLCIGYFAIDALLPWLQESRYWPAYQTAVEWFGRWGFWAVFVAGFSPIPYKVFTIAAGALSMALLPFALASLIGRGARFFLVAGLMAWGGARMEEVLHRYVERLGWAVVALVAVAVLWFGNS